MPPALVLVVQPTKIGGKPLLGLPGDFQLVLLKAALRGADILILPGQLEHVLKLNGLVKIADKMTALIPHVFSGGKELLFQLLPFLIQPAQALCQIGLHLLQIGLLLLLPFVHAVHAVPSWFPDFPICPGVRHMIPYMGREYQS